jgi:hypothetical protein
VFFGLAKFGADERVHAEQFKNSGNGEKGALISCSELKRPIARVAAGAFGFLRRPTVVVSVTMD